MKNQLMEFISSTVCPLRFNKMFFLIKAWGHDGLNLHKHSTLWTPLYLAWFTMLFCNKSQRDGKRFIKESSLCFKRVRRGFGNTDWHTDERLFGSSNQGQKLSAPFPLKPHKLDGTKEVLFSARRMPRVQPVVSCCDNVAADISDLRAAPGGLSQPPLMASPVTFPNLWQHSLIWGRLFYPWLYQIRPAARHHGVYSLSVDAL